MARSKLNLKKKRTKIEPKSKSANLTALYIFI